jgi:hypothetical protein
MQENPVNKSDVLHSFFIVADFLVTSVCLIQKVLKIIIYFVMIYCITK